MTKKIKLPEKELLVVEPDGTRTDKKVNAFVNLAAILVENAPQKNDTDAYLAHSIREKLDATKNGELELEDSEIVFLQGALEELRKKGQIAGSNWYFVVDGLRSAEATRRSKDDRSNLETAAH